MVRIRIIGCSGYAGVAQLGPQGLVKVAVGQAERGESMKSGFAETHWLWQRPQLQ